MMSRTMYGLHKHDARSERGAALLIAIFALLLISVVGIAMIVSTGTDSALTGNYRTSTGAYYAALAGLEEARGRLLRKNQNYINITNNFPTLMAPSGLPTWGLTQVLYIVNPASGETVDPTSALPANYPDIEYQSEFGWPLSGAVVNEIPSVSPDSTASPSLPGQSFKWVRINPITEQSLNLDVNADGVLDGAGVLYYDPAHVNSSNPSQPAPGLVVSAPSTPPTPPTPTSVQAVEITALAVLPSGSRRLLQYVVAPLVISPDVTDQSFPAALTLDGNGVFFQGPTAIGSYSVAGIEPCNPPPPPGLPNSVPAIGYTNPADYGSVYAHANIHPPNYPGFPLTSPPPPPGYTPTTPSVANVALRQSWLAPATLDAAMQDIEKSADVVINGPATGTDISNLAPTMSAANPMTIVVNGNLSLNSWQNTGFGLLLVTGTLTYDPDASWNGIVLVVGQGIFISGNSGYGGFNGAVFVATTRDSSNNLLPGNSLGASCFGNQVECTGFGGHYGSNPGAGVSYNSCWINTARGPLTYKVLSFREIPLTN